jgi:hypothetical protein
MPRGTAGTLLPLLPLLVAMLLGCEDMGELVEDEGEIPCVPVSFAADVEPLLATSCALSGCHVPPVYAGGLDLRTGFAYSSLLVPGAAAPCMLNRVEPFDPERSVLYRRLAGTDCGPRMPQSPLPALPEDERQLIYCWIEQGALQN